MVAENTVTPTLNGPGRSGASMFVFDAVAIWVACALSIPAAVRVVKTNTNVHADAKAILKAMAGIGSPFGSRGFIGSGSGREKSWKTTSSRRLTGFSDRAGARSRRRAQFLEQPGARGLPVPVGGCRR